MQQTMSRTMAAGLGLFLLAACGAENEPDSAPHASDFVIHADRLAEHARILSSDEFQGRPPSGVAAEPTLNYLTSQLAAAGLQPVFDGSFLQPVPMLSIEADPKAAFKITSKSGERRYGYGSEMMVWTTREAESISVNDSELVFVGYGINAPEFGWNDYEGLDMAGRTAVMLINDPGFATQNSALFDGNAMTYYGRWTYKYEEAARQGASAAIIIHETAPASYGWEVVRNSWTGPQFDLVRPDGNASRVAAEGWVQDWVAEEIFTDAGLDYAALKAAAAQRDFKAIELRARLSVALENRLEQSLTHNVAGRIEGRIRPDETVLYTAHWDHLGTENAVEVNPVIYNGAIDNATSVAAIIEIARAMASREIVPERSVVFLLTGAEEQGLLGAYHYAEQPPFPLALTAGLINLDILHPLGVMDDVTVIGSGTSELEKILAEVLADQGRRITPYPNPEQGMYFRSDQFAFTQRGVPALFVHTGSTPVDGSRESVAAAKATYMRETYHTGEDRFDPAWDWRGTAMDMEALAETGWRLAQSRTWPQWYAGAPFKAEREHTQSQRDK